MLPPSDNSEPSKPNPAPRPTPPPAYFLSLEVENIRCFGPRQTLDLSDGTGHPRQWTVILGDNGVGKTTLLQCLAGLEATASPIPYNRAKGMQVLAVGDFPREFQYALIRTDGGSVSRVSSVVGVGNVLQGRIGEANEEFRWFGKWYQEGTWLRTAELPATQIGGLKCYGYGAARRIGKGQLTANGTLAGTLFRACETLFIEDASLINAEEWMLQADYAARIESPVQKQAEAKREKVKEVLLALLPADVEDIRIAPPTEKRDRPGVEFKTPYGWVSLRDLSLGYQTLIAWMVDLAARLFERYPASPNPLAEPAIVLVDEIDLHLHPSWQRTLMRFLTERFPNTQFIVTAHSPLIVQAASDANIVLLRREGDHVVIDQDVKTVRGWRIDQVLASDLFGGIPARPPDVAEALEERRRLVAKRRRSKADEQKLRELDSLAAGLPTAETPEDIEAMDIIRQAAKHLKAKGETGG